MNVNEASVLEMINRLIATDRLNKQQILQLVNLASISNSINQKLIIVVILDYCVDTSCTCAV